MNRVRKRVPRNPVATIVMVTLVLVLELVAIAPMVATAQTAETIVYITETGKKYHRSDCRTLGQSKIPISLEEAVKQGYEPCKICNPPAPASEPAPGPVEPQPVEPEPVEPGSESMPSGTFADIKGHWAQSDIEVMAGLGIVRGIGEDRFGPEMPVNRAQFATFLIRSLDIEEVTHTTSHFKDVPSDAWYCGAVEGAYAADLIKGFEDGTFKPDQKINREEIGVLIARALKKGGQEVTADDVDAVLARFKDANEISSWAKEEATQAVVSGIISGRDGSFVPKATATRAEAVVMLKRMLVKLGVI